MKLFPAALVPFLVLIAACTTSRQQAREYVQSGTDSVDRLTQSQYDAALASGADPDVLLPREEKFQEQVANQRARYAELEKEFAQQSKLVSDLITTLSTALGAGANPAGIAQALAARFFGIEKKAERVEDRVDDAELAKEEHAKAVAELEKKIADTEKAIAEAEKAARAELETYRKDVLEQVKTRLGENSAEFEKLAAKLEKVSDATLLKLGSLSEKSVGELESLRLEDAEFRAKLQEKARLTDEQMKELEGLTTEELLTILGAAAAAAAGGGILGKTGKSRGAEEIARLKAQLDGQQAELIQLRERAPK